MVLAWMKDCKYYQISELSLGYLLYQIFQILSGQKQLGKYVILFKCLHICVDKPQFFVQLPKRVVLYI